MVTGFAAGGLVELVPALAVMLGANVGTTLIVQVLSFNITGLAPCLFLIGLVMFNRGDATRTRDLGRVAIGLGLMLLSLHQLLEVITPYEDVPSLRMFMGAIATQPVLGRPARRRHYLGGTFQRRNRFAGHVVCRQRGHSAGGRVCFGARRQSRDRDQSVAGGGRRRRSVGEAAAVRQSAEPRIGLRRRRWRRCR